ncbi:hypothetical protein BH09GEM1_BH09GEM1_35810 [soil metagenome]
MRLRDFWRKLEYRVSVLRSADILIEDFIARHLHGNPKYEDPKRLNRFEFQIYSQTGEDGIIQEIFARIGTTNKRFVEFGVGNGLQNNTVALLLYGWSGAWIDGDAALVRRINESLRVPISTGLLRIKTALVMRENIESHFRDLDVPAEFDLLSIDIDGNDYWVWEAINQHRPRVVVVEYNAQFGPSLAWVQKYNASHQWSGSNHFGASLKALEVLATKKGYRLVACNFLGNNAFFVRSDLAGEKFLENASAEAHFEPARYYLFRQNGFPREFGEYTIVSEESDACP